MDPQHPHQIFVAGCAACQKRDRDRARIRRRAIAYGDWPNQKVPAGPVLQHVAALCPPMNPNQVAELAGISDRVLTRLRNGRGDRLQRWVADAILGVRPQPPRLLSAVPSCRKLQALACDGWSLNAITAHTGIDRSTLFHVRYPLVQSVTHRTHNAVDRAYQEMWLTPGPSGWVRATATAKWGYLPHEAWPDDTIDDPQAQPQRPPPSVDNVVLERVVRDPGLFGEMNAAEQAELYRRRVVVGSDSDYRFRKVYRPRPGVMPAIYGHLGLPDGRHRPAPPLASASA